MNDETSPQELELPSVVWDELIQTLRANLRLILIIVVLVVLGAYTALQFVSWKYEASARVLVKLGRENTELPAAAVRRGGLLTTGVRKEEINSEIQLLTSDALITDVVDAIGYEHFLFAPKRPDDLLGIIKYYLKLGYRGFKQWFESVAITLGLRQRYSDHDKVVLAVKDYLNVVREKDSDVISIHLRLPDPDLAVLTIDRLLERYLDRHITVRQSQGIKGFFARQAKEYADELAAIEARRDALKARLGISDIGQQRRHLLDHINELETRIETWQGLYRNLPETQGDRAIIKRLALPLVTNETLPVIQNEIVERRLALERRLTSYGADSRPTDRLTRELASLQDYLRNGLVRLIARNQAILERERQALERLDAGESQLGRLERQRALIEKNYLTYAERQQEAGISERLDERRVSNIAVLAPPKRPIKPVAPKKMLIVALSFPVGLLLAIGIVLLREYLNDRVRSAHDLRRLGGLNYLGRFRLGS